jgi:hypothetical protein
VAHDEAVAIDCELFGASDDVVLAMAQKWYLESWKQAEKAGRTKEI